MIFYSLIKPDANQHDEAYRLLAVALKREYAVSLDDMRLLRGARGKPYFDNSGIYFNISHCKGMVCCITADCECGIDCEAADRGAYKAAERIFSQEERASLAVFDDRPSAKAEYFSCIWTLKEACAKADGRGIYTELAGQTFSVPEGILFQNGFYTRSVALDGFIISAAAANFDGVSGNIAEITADMN